VGRMRTARTTLLSEDSKAGREGNLTKRHGDVGSGEGVEQQGMLQKEAKSQGAGKTNINRGNPITVLKGGKSRIRLTFASPRKSWPERFLIDWLRFLLGGDTKREASL